MPAFPLPGFLEVEVGSYCNRRCAWCPNGWHDRGQTQRSMAPATWRALLDDLGAARFRGWFAFHNYNEPLADPALFDRLADARAALPDAKLELHTNGDFLDAAMLARLRKATVDLVRVTLYPTDARAFAPPDARRIGRFLARAGLRPSRAKPVEKRSKLEQSMRVGALDLVVRVPKIAHYTARAGSVGLAELQPTGPRTRPCLLPFHSAAIDFHGALKLCCHIYDSTTRESAPYVLGNVGQTPFRALWSGERMQQLRAQLARGDFTGLPECGRCTHQTPEWMVKKVTPLVRQLGG